MGVCSLARLRAGVEGAMRRLGRSHTDEDEDECMSVVPGPRLRPMSGGEDSGVRSILRMAMGENNGDGKGEDESRVGEAEAGHGSDGRVLLNEGAWRVVVACCRALSARVAEAEAEAEREREGRSDSDGAMVAGADGVKCQDQSTGGLSLRVNGIPVAEYVYSVAERALGAACACTEDGTDPGALHDGAKQQVEESTDAARQAPAPPSARNKASTSTSAMRVLHEVARSVGRPRGSMALASGAELCELVGVIPPGVHARALRELVAAGERHGHGHGDGHGDVLALSPDGGDEDDDDDLGSGDIMALWQWAAILDPDRKGLWTWMGGGGGGRAGAGTGTGT